MKPIEDMLKNCSFDHSLDENFETKVYAKIKRKKTIKRVGYSFTAFFIAGVILFLSFYFLGPNQDQDDALKNRYATGSPENTEKSLDTKEEIPLIEHVYFSSSDERESYAIEQVSYSEEDEDGI